MYTYIFNVITDVKRKRRENGGLQAGECLPAPPPEEGSRGGGAAEAAAPEASEGTRQPSYNFLRF